MAETHRLWDKIKAGEFDVVISSVDTAEINDCDDSKRETLFGFLGEIAYTFVEINDRTSEIARKLVDLGVLRQTNFDDCQHIAAAIISECDVIVSWNFKHMVNPRTAKGVRAVTALEGYKDILIYDPLSLIGGEAE
jgi:hypothetical protein